MSAGAPPEGKPLARRASAYESREIGELRMRRREARRRRGLLRLDIGLGVLGALVLLLVTPGVAFAAIVALLLLAACVVSVAVERWRSQRSRASR